VPEGEAVTRELLRREILVDHRPGAGIRYSPHFYSTDEEVLHAIDQTREILDSGAYRPHLRAGGPGF
jgi:kynureninase